MSKLRLFVLLLSLFTPNAFAEENPDYLPTPPGEGVIPSKPAPAPKAKARPRPQISQTYSYKPVSIGLLAGWSKPMGSSTSGTSARLGWGGEFGYKIQDNIGLGIYYLSSSGTVTDTLADFNVTCYGLDSTFFFGGRGAYFGARAGLSSVGISLGALSATTNPFSFGGKVGYDYAFNSGLSLGVEGNLMFFAKSSNAGLTSEAFQLLNIFAAIRYWF
ncbi:MAG TPA: outer membrane beta-barrel protein [Bdellovibrionota bacterium]|jgi:hypothetical protein